MDIEAFAQGVLRRPLWSHQLEAARSDRFVTTLAAARRTGKTTLAEAMAMHTAFSTRGSKVLILSATQDAARRLTESIGARLESNQLTRGAVVDAYSTRVKLVNGSEIVSLPASQRQVRGYGEGVLLVILDEAGFQAGEMWQAAHYCALDERRNGSRILLIGTPWGPADHFFRRSFEAGLDGDQDHASFHWRAEVNPNLDRAYLERMRDRVAPAEYAAEVLGEWSDATGSLFPRDLLERQTADFVPTALRELPPGPRLAVGVDYGVSFDQSAAVAIARLPISRLNPDRDPLPRYGVVTVEIWPAGAPLTNVAQGVARSPATWAAVSSEISGVGAGPTQELIAALTERMRDDRSRRFVKNEVHTTSALKTTGYSWVLSLLEREQLILPRDPTLLRQLAGLRFEVGERGFTRIEAASPALHDDTADALMLAAGPHYSRGKPRCALAIAATASRAIPEPDLRTPADLVTTGGGLVLPRRGALQSVQGTEWWEPEPGAAETDPDPHADLRERIQQRREEIDHAA